MQSGDSISDTFLLQYQVIAHPCLGLTECSVSQCMVLGPIVPASPLVFIKITDFLISLRFGQKFAVVGVS